MAVISIWGAITGCATNRAERGTGAVNTQVTAYEQLIALYPEDSQGLGKENFFPTVEHQPMTYGLIVSAESFRYRKTHGDESRRRIRKAVRWLLDNQDLDKDGLPGWGLPQAWDAFGDGTTNSVNQPYTITSAIVLNGLLDSLTIKDFWSGAERDEMRSVMARVIVRWCRSLWSQGYTGGFFWYSPSPVDAIFAVNSPSMFMGSMARMLHEQGDAFNAEERALVQSRTDDMARAVISTVDLRRGLPFWNYRPGYVPGRANDLVHHVYTLWGIETYRDCGGMIKPTWTRQQAIQSVDRFWKDGQIRAFPQDVTYTGEQVNYNSQPAVLWSAGSMLAAYAQWGQMEKARQTLQAIERDYGPWPDLRLHISSPQGPDSFYPRQAAHVLWGLALYAFGR